MSNAPKLKHSYSNALRHGHARSTGESPTYVSWCAMLTRCRNILRDTQKKHAGRGITVCDRWLSFDNFLADMGERPAGKTLERIDNDKGYAFDNCRWATPIEQARNRRSTRLDYPSAVAVAIARLRGESCGSIAKRYGISESLPREIVKGRTWPDASRAAHKIFEGDKNDCTS